MVRTESACTNDSNNSSNLGFTILNVDDGTHSDGDGCCDKFGVLWEFFTFVFMKFDFTVLE